MNGIALVIGGTGKTGRNVVDGLTERGWKARAASRHGDVLFDWELPDTWAEALSGVDAVYIVGPQAPMAGDAAMAEFVPVAVRAGARRLVLLSALGIDQAEGTPMRAVEKSVEDSGVDWTILRPNWFFQNFSEGFLVPGVLAGELRVPAGDARLSFIDVRDIAAVAVAALTDDGHAGQGYALTGPRAVTFAEMAAAIEQASGRPVRYVDVPPDAAREEMLGGGVPVALADMLLGMFAGVRAGWNQLVTDVVPRVTGRPAIDLDRYVIDAVDAWRR